MLHRFGLGLAGIGLQVLLGERRRVVLVEVPEEEVEAVFSGSADPVTQAAEDFLVVFLAPGAVTVQRVVEGRKVTVHRPAAPAGGHRLFQKPETARREARTERAGIAPGERHQVDGPPKGDRPVAQGVREG